MYDCIKGLTFEESRMKLYDNIRIIHAIRSIIVFDSSSGIDSYSEDSDVTVLYDAFNRLPLIITERIPIKGKDGLNFIKGKVNEDTCTEFSKVTEVTENGKYIDIIYVRSDAYDIFTSENN